MDSPTSKKDLGKTVAILLGIMGFAAMVTLWGTLRTIQGRRSRDVPATQLPESSLLAKLPAQSRQVMASRPGWPDYASLLQTLLSKSVADSLKNPAPIRWVAGWPPELGDPMLVAEFQPGIPNPEGWQPAGKAWTRKGLEPPASPAGGDSLWAPGLSLVVKNRLRPEAVVWVAAVGTPWKVGLGQRLWNGLATATEASRVAEWAADAKTWLVWVEPQPDRALVRADLECASPQEANRLEKALESAVPPGSPLRFLADGPWLSLQYSLPAEPKGSKPAAR